MEHPVSPTQQTQPAAAGATLPPIPVGRNKRKHSASGVMQMH